MYGRICDLFREISSINEDPPVVDISDQLTTQERRACLVVTLDRSRLIS